MKDLLATEGLMPDLVEGGRREILGKVPRQLATVCRRGTFWRLPCAGNQWPELPALPFPPMKLYLNLQDLKLVGVIVVAVAAFFVALDVWPGYHRGKKRR